MKCCVRCRTAKPLACFYEKEGGHHSWCKPCVRDAERERRQSNPDKWKDGYLRRTYGITLEQYRQMHDAQCGVCAICAQPETRRRKRGVDPLAVDHDHDTGAVRGLLCHRCNSLIGLANDAPARLQAAAEYLERSTA